MIPFAHRPLPRCLAAILAGLGLALSLAAAEPLQKVVVQLPYRHQFQFAGLYAAQTQGFFRAQGLEVELRTNSNERSKPLNEVLEGRAQFGILPGPKLVASRLDGADVVVVAAIMQHSPRVMLARAESNIRTPQDLLGKRVGLDDASQESEVRVMLDREGVDLSKIVVVPDRWDIEELEAGQVDAESSFVTDAPYFLERSGMKVNIIRPIDYGIDYYGDSLYTTGTVARQQRDLVEAMRKAVTQGWEYALQHPDELIDWIVANLPDRMPMMDRVVLQYEARQVARLINADLVNLGHMNEGRWRVMGQIIQAAKAGRKLERLDGFVYVSQENEANQFQWIFRWLWWGLIVAVVVALLALLTTWRLRRLVERRTRELKESERQQREIFDLSPAPITRNDYGAILPHLQRLRASGVTDLDAHLTKNPDRLREWCGLVRVIDANQLALRVAGVASVEELDRGRMAMLPEDTIEVFRQELQAIWDGRDHLRLEKTYQRRDGRRLDALINWSAPPRSGHPDYTHVQLVHTDLTEIHEAGRALRDSEARYRQIFEQAPIAVVEFDYTNLQPWFAELRAQGVTSLGAYLQQHPEAKAKVLQLAPMTNVNAAAVKLINARTKKEVLERVRDIFTESAIETRCTNVARVWDGLLESVGEFEVRRLDGQLRTLSFQWQMQQENGVPIFSRTQVLLTDVTERLAAEQALRESESRYRGLFENAVGGVYRSTPDGRFLAVNPALVRMLGFDSIQALMDYDIIRGGQPLYVQPGRREEFRALLAHGDNVTNFESEVRCKNGTTIWISENVRIVRDEQGKDLYHEGFVSDVTMHRRLDQEMQRASKLEAVGILAGGIAHDFNNILTVVLGNITLVETDAGPAAPGAQLLREAKRATLRARDLTQQLLTFAKGGEPVRAAVNLPELLRETTEFALHGAKARAEFQIAGDLWPVNADKGQLGQVVQNLVINSVQAMPDGGILRVGAGNTELGEPAGSMPLPAGRYVHLTVADTGTGISADHLAKIFDPYFTTKQQGSGLGLATVYSIVKKHQGHIEVESQLGRGTTFHLWLPAATQAVAEKVPEKTGGAVLPARVLFMDDEDTIRRMAFVFMSRLNLECELAADGAEAVRKFQAARAANRPFDVVLMDLTVPGGMGGREAMELLRKIDPNVRAIVSSGYSHDPVMASYQAHGFRGVLPKPYDIGQLRQVLEDTLRSIPPAAGR